MIANLPRREREIFEILCSAGEASAADIRRRMEDAPSHSAVRTLLARLEDRGLVTHRTEDQAYIYKSVPQPAKIRESALAQMVRTFLQRIGGERGDRAGRHVEEPEARGAGSARAGDQGSEGAPVMSVSFFFEWHGNRG